MTLRRDFLAFTAGAIVARTVLPIGAMAEPLSPRAELEAMARRDANTAKMLEWWDGADEHARACFVRFLKRVHLGDTVEQAGELFRLEMAEPAVSA